jgi:arylsulfatase A-like enzyme
MLRDGIRGNFASTIDTTDVHFVPAKTQWAQRQEGLKTFNDNLVALLDYVDSRGWTDNFTWIVTSDQGVHHGEYGIYLDGGSKYFAKQTAYEPSCRAPLCIVASGLAPQVVTRPTHHFDLPFTVLDLFGATDHPVHDLRDGVSLLRLLDPTLYPQRAIALNHLIPGTSTVNALIDATNFKFVEAQPLTTHANLQVAQLYDLTNDPDETTNLATAMPDVLTAMRARAKVMHSARGPAYRNNTG